MASRLFALVSLALIVAGISAFLVAAGYPMDLPGGAVRDRAPVS